MSRLSFQRVTRETRLLATTLVVSIVVLFLLARFRYPAPEPTGDATTQPLARLAATASYEELANAIERLGPRALPLLVTLRVDPGETRDDFEPFAWRAPAVDLPRFVPALRVRDDRAIAVLPPGARVQGMIGSREVPTIVSTDAIRGVVLLEVAKQSAAVISVWDSGAPLDTPRYVAAAEGTRGGPTLRPLFLGRTDPVRDLRWNTALLALGGAGAAPIGSFVFALDGRLAGAIVDTEGGAAILPADALMRVSDQLAEGGSLTTGDLGLTAQVLTPALAMATGARSGVVIAFVDPTGPTAKTVRVGDVVWAIRGETVYSADGFGTRVARMRPGTPVKLSLMRGGRKLEVDATVRAHEGGASAAAPAGLGLVMRQADGLGAEVMRVLPRSAAAYAGLAPGDLITQMDSESVPTPSTVQRLYGQAKPGRLLIVGVERRGKFMVLALAK
ncbi:MAG: PDZ domain-containing protein [Luteitalea sp.]|nr:PDZ domain-containing protein [Luteitalea sp.]